MSVHVSPETGAPVRHLSGLAEIAQRYDGFLLDQWGVLHDGTTPYPGAIDCLERLRSAGKAIIILSNSGRGARENEELIARMGFARALYDHVVSAGDDARDALLTEPDPFYRALGRRCYLFARDGEDHLIDGLGLARVERIEDADFLFTLSMNPPQQSLAGCRSVLEAAVARDLPMICGNPDLYRVHADGTLHEAPGLVARTYAEMGGRVRYHGKPEPRIYRSSLQRLGLAPRQVLAVGDSLEHDVAGATGAGIDVAFIAGGIHRQDLGWPTSGTVDRASCARLFGTSGWAPGYVLPYFAW
ncbi:TIGR01459 family HAD-type hydrolase [Bosea sp. 2KB_26]|uniref:TIGR01459 family HAD-type hydrolase n=1 Tax=Bosea sp. 2KB_26 TaxID=3237475 RepID=UPI003F8FF2C1